MLEIFNPTIEVCTDGANVWNKLKVDYTFKIHTIIYSWRTGLVWLNVPPIIHHSVTDFTCPGLWNLIENHANKLRGFCSNCTLNVWFDFLLGSACWTFQAREGTEEVFVEFWVQLTICEKLLTDLFRSFTGSFNIHCNMMTRTWLITKVCVSFTELFKPFLCCKNWNNLFFFHIEYFLCRLK